MSVVSIQLNSNSLSTKLLFIPLLCNLFIYYTLLLCLSFLLKWIVAFSVGKQNENKQMNGIRSGLSVATSLSHQIYSLIHSMRHEYLQNSLGLALDPFFFLFSCWKWNRNRKRKYLLLNCIIYLVTCFFHSSQIFIVGVLLAHPLRLVYFAWGYQIIDFVFIFFLIG